MKRLFVGGPLDGELRDVPDDHIARSPWGAMIVPVFDSPTGGLTASVRQVVYVPMPISVASEHVAVMVVSGMSHDREAVHAALRTICLRAGLTFE